LNSKEAIAWIKSTLNRVKAKTVDKNILAVINSNLKMIEQEKIDSINSITRKDFLEKVYKYLVLNKDVQVSIKYRDLSSDDNKKANSIFDAQNTWKDKF
jgi:fructose-1,6-bisphosphatase